MSQDYPFDHGGPVDQRFEPFPHAALDGSIVDRFESTARRFAARLAVSDCVREFTYAELADLVDQIAHATASTAAGRDGPVAILLASDAFFPAAMLGVLAAGRGYVPLDPNAPFARNHLIVEHAGAAAVVSTGEPARWIREALQNKVPVIDVNTLGGNASRRRPAAHDLAYIIYTSGSTGTPKGVYQNHRNALHRVMEMGNALHISPEDRLPLARAPGAIGATNDVLMATLNGASLHVLPPLDLQPAGLVREIKRRKLTVYRSSPTLMRRIAEALAPGERLDTVRVVQLVSERMGWGDYDIFRRIFAADAHLMVGMGSTECSIARWFVDGSLRTASTRLPVGRALPDRTVSLVDARGRPTPDGEIGEFVVASRYAALGYWRDPDATAQAFKPDPTDPEARIFKPGDLGLRRPDGLFEFVGRKDDQIKLRGHRIEPVEIENVLAACGGVKDAAVVVRRNATGAPRSLAAYVELRSKSETLRPVDLTTMLAERLPGYMVPPTMVVVDELPRLANFKVDRVRLAKIDADRVARAAPAAGDAMISEVARIFEQIIGVADATADDNVMSLGGDLLQAVRVALELEHRFRLVIPPHIFQTSGSIGELTKWIAACKTRRGAGVEP